MDSVISNIDIVYNEDCVYFHGKSHGNVRVDQNVFNELIVSLNKNINAHSITYVVFKNIHFDEIEMKELALFLSSKVICVNFLNCIFNECDFSELTISYTYFTYCYIVRCLFDHCFFDAYYLFSFCSIEHCSFCNMYISRENNFEIGGSYDYKLFDLCGITATDFSGTDFNNMSFKYNCIFKINLKDAKNIGYVPYVCPEEGEFIGWKKALNNNDDILIVKLLIPCDAKRSSSFDRKCRCSKAKVIEIQKLDGTKYDGLAYSSFDNDFVYEAGKEVSVDNFDDNRWNECSTGIHFFMDRQEAVEY